MLTSTIIKIVFNHENSLMSRSAWKGAFMAFKRGDIILFVEVHMIFMTIKK